MAYLSNLNCCAIKELSSISMSNPKDVIIQMYKSENYAIAIRPAFILFTARDEAMPEYEYGRNFKKFILDNKLGNVVESNAKRNIRSCYATDKTHDMRMYIWELDHKAIDEWYEKNKPPEPPQIKTKPIKNNGWLF